MTSSVSKTTIMNKLSDVLPDLLSTAGLNNFDDYLDEQPKDIEKIELGIYTAEESDTTDYHSLIFIIQAQLYKQGDWKQEYHSVIMAAVRDNITAELIGFIVRDRISADIWPVDKNGSSFIFYEIEFSEELDDSD